VGIQLRKDHSGRHRFKNGRGATRAEAIARVSVRSGVVEDPRHTWFRRDFQKDDRFKHEFTADISDEGIHIVTPFSDGLVKWNGFVRFLESNEIFMLCVAPWNFFIFPKRAFAQGEITEFRSLLQRKIVSRG
jgi:hypothetical protein